jgi:exosortase C (VPDSG-CTERM-specific)
VERLIASAGEKAGASATPEAHTPVRRSRLARRWLAFLFFIVGLIAAFANPLASLAIHAAGSDLHSHVLLIPFVSAYLIYNRRNHLPKEYDSSPGWAVVPLLVGVAALIAAWGGRVFGEPLTDNDYLALTTLSFICLLIAGGFFFLGRKWMAATAFPFAFLIFMVPMPEAMADILETASKLASAEAANLFFHLSGTPVFRNGTVFQLPNITIQVAQECSGIRSSWVLFITSLLAGNLFLKSNWRRMLLICFVLPLAILRNGFRVCVIGMLCVSFGPQMINSIIHRRGGPLFFALSLIPLFFLLWWLRRGEVVTSQKAK